MNKKFRNLRKGISVLELLIVVTIFVILGVTGVSFYRNYVKIAELESTAKIITSDLKSVRAKAMAGEDDSKWGVRFVNGASDYYDIFSTASDYNSGSVKTTVFLPKAVEFSTPGEGINLDVIFNKISATSTDASVAVSSEGKTETVTVTAEGSVN